MPMPLGPKASSGLGQGEEWFRKGAVFKGLIADFAKRKLALTEPRDELEMKL
jgi:hypothetical protein